jgi:RNA polymerase sigma-70 factor (ECF subfamily)
LSTEPAKKDPVTTHLPDVLGQSRPEDRARVEPPAQVPDFAQLFREMAPFVWRALRRLGVRERDAEDLLQEVFLAVHRKLPEFEGRSSVRTWVYGFCLRKALDYRRLARVRREVVAQALPEQACESDREHQLDVRRACARLDAVLDTLDDDKRAVFVLFELEQVSMKEIAELTCVPVQTAYFRLYAARKHVREALRAVGGEP